MDIYNGNRLRIEEGIFTLPDGKKRRAVVVHPNGAVVILPIKDGICYLIRQWRLAIGQYILEAPAGTLEPGEDPLATAHRELIEETGFAAKEMILRGYIFTTPGFSDEKIFIYEATNLSPSNVYLPDDDEIIELVEVPVQDLFRLIHEGEIVDAKTIAAIVRCIGRDP
ncbi:MAG TPA: NUDIX hydrolase [Methanospirillum sp.]|nr:NUDIX hydrolase [Methanospirillum sp.]